MDGIVRASINRGKNVWGRFYRRRWLRRGTYIVVAAFIIYSLFGFIGVPYLLRRILTGQVAASLHRPISAGRIAFNPYKLRLDVDRLHISDRDPQLAFVDLEHLTVQASWASLLHLAPIVSELTLVRPEIHTIRTAPQSFNFSDLITRPANQPAPPSKKPARFAVYNIDVYDGAVYLDDRVLSQHHQADQIRLGVPFIANLPSKVSIFVQPLLQMRIDGSPFRLAGRTKPFEKTQDTIVDLSLHRLDLPSYFAYLPMRPPVQLRNGMLSTLLHLHFINTADQPHISVDGGMALDSIDLRDAAGAPLLTLNHAAVDLAELEPLEKEVHVKRIYVDGLATYLVRNADGTTNLTPLTQMQKAPPPAASPMAAASPIPSSAVSPPASSPSVAPAPSVTPTSAITPAPSPTPTASNMPAATPSPSSTPSTSPGATPTAYLNAQAQLAAPAAIATPPPLAPAAKPTLNLVLDSFEMVNSSAQVTDRSHLAAPATLALTSIHTKVSNFKLPAQAPAPFDFGANLSTGGALSASGTLALANHQAQLEAALSQLNLAALKAFAAPYLNGDLQSGRLDAQAKLTADFSGPLNVHVEPATAAVTDFAIKSTDGKEEPLAWDKFSAKLAQFDLASRTAIVSQVESDGLRVFGRRDRGGQLNLLALLKARPTATAPAPRPVVKHAARHAYHHLKVEQHRTAPPATSPASLWHYRIAAVNIDKAAITGIDERGTKPVKIDLAPFNLSLKDVSDNLAKPITIALDTMIDRRGSLKISGDAAPAPLDAKLEIRATRVDLTALDAYIGDQVNARLAAAFLTMDGTAAATNHRGHLRASYRGDLTLGGVRVLDKVTGETFTRWNSFNARRIDAEYGGRVPKLHIGGVALSDFYARLILNRDGRLNIKDVTGNPHERPRSLTRAEAQAAPPAPTPAATAPGATATPAKPLDADIAIGGVTLSGGKINWSDYFIRPNYSADLARIGGKIGAFSTSSSRPADVVLNGLVNGSAPLSISGAVNPLAPMASLDITAKADSIELPGISTYSVKYLGYPIVKGTLTVDVHYILKDQNLTAQNHIFIDQLTFGDKVESKTALNLPIRLAVAVLKDPSGAIKLDIPVSGSLNDPEFSIGSVIWGVLKNLIVRAATAPFNLIASAFGGNKSGQPLNYVDFTPGYAQLTPDDDKRLDVVAKALEARPSLKLDITGRVDPKLDREGLRFAKVDDAVKAQWRKSQGGAESGAANVPKSEYDKYLKKAYKAAKFDKPTDVLGLTKSLPPDEMKKLMVAHETVSEADLQNLAQRRAGAVRAALVQRHIAPDRLFIVTPKLTAEGISDQGKTTRADLSIS